MTAIHLQLSTVIISGLVQLSYVALTAYGIRVFATYLTARLSVHGAEPARRETYEELDPVLPAASFPMFSGTGGGSAVRPPVPNQTISIRG